MTAKDYLLRAWQIEERIRHRQEEQARLRTMLDAEVDENSGRKSAEGTGLREVRRAVCDMDAAIEEEILALCRVRREVNAVIGEVEDVRLRQLLELRYRSYLTWDAIANEMKYDLRHVYRLHREALRCVDKGCRRRLESAG